MIKRHFSHIILALCVLFSACIEPRSNVSTTEKKTSAVAVKQQELSKTARLLDSLGYVNILKLDSAIQVDIIYATPDNFVGEVLYEDLKEAYLLPEAAAKVVSAHQALQKLHPNYRFIIYDAARPMSVQRKMWTVAVRTG